MTEEETGVCVICGGIYEHYGNNPFPVTNFGRCCDYCNERVILERVQEALEEVRK